MRKSLTTRPTQSVWDFMNEMDQVFNKVFDSPMSATSSSLAEMVDFAPPVDIEENKDFYLLSFDIPGVDAKDVKIDVSNGQLTVSGQRVKTHREEQGPLRRYERQFGQFTRSFMLPTQVEEDKIQARHEGGVLEIMIPKSGAAKPKTIKIESEKGGLFSRLLGKTDKESGDQH